MKMNKNSGKLFIGLGIIFFSIGTVVLGVFSGQTANLLAICGACVGMGLMSLVFDTNRGQAPRSMGAHFLSNISFMMALALGLLLRYASREDPNLEMLVYPAEVMACACVSLMLPYFASRYPAGSPLIKYASPDLTDEG